MSLLGDDLLRLRGKGLVAGVGGGDCCWDCWTAVADVLVGS